MQREKHADIHGPCSVSARVLPAKQHVKQTLVRHKFIMETFLTLDLFIQAKRDVI